MKTSGNLFIITAPSGAGKTSLVSALLESDPHLKLSISYTTRPPRPGEIDGVDYHFVDEARFLQMQEAGDFLESAQVHGARYGTSQRWVEDHIKEGEDILLEIDWQGATQVRGIFPQAIGIFILPPSLEELERRLRKRGQDAPEIIARRLANAREEIGHVGEFDYVIINDQFDEALKDLQSIIRARRLRADKQLRRYAEMITQLK
ncbi:MAG: guanylate kinase [Methylophilaceae bacterium]|nr:guanylate kinase [Methylophilaceae bacterium]